MRGSLFKKEYVALYTALILLAIFMLLPTVSLTIISIKTMQDIAFHGTLSKPTQLNLDSYVKALNGLSGNLLSSFIITIPSVFLSVFVGAIVGFILSRFDFKLRNEMVLFFILGMMIPQQMVLIPLYIIANKLGIYDTYLALILVHSAYGIPIVSLLLRNFMITIPDEILEAAILDGCGTIRLFFQIVLPISKIALTAATILQFTYIWNDLLWALVLTRSINIQPVTMAIVRFSGQYVVDWPTQAAGAIIASLPPLIVFMIFQNYFEQGVIGAIKR
ncbi:MAG: carbohydrate ABC transporter permease [Thermoproteales archaeon]|nr:carbohydrate ABC transporter permease [Thermoproteales archaeon]